MADKDEEKKIIVDTDWKEQAQKEKEELVKEQEEKKEEAAQPTMPPASFPGLVSLLATQAFYALGLIRADENKEVEPNFDVAKYNIDSLVVLQEKTKGNISKEEEKMLDDTIGQLRMAFVKLSE